MSLRDSFNAAMKEALKAGDKARLSAVRLIIAAIKNLDVDARGAGKGSASDEDIVVALQKMIKQRHESADLYDKGSRPELAAQERAEIAVISTFLPAQLSESEVAAAIKDAIAATGATSIKDMGKVMAALKERHTGKMDFAKAGAAVKAALGA